MRRRIAALVVAAAAATFGITMVMGAGTPASAQGVPTKTCTDPSTTSGVAKAGDTITCTIDIVGVLGNGVSFVITPSAPTGAYIPANGCAGASAGTAPFVYQTQATETGGGTTSSTCTFTVSTGALGVGQNEIGTERLFIPPATAANTSVTQTAAECLTAAACLPATPMGVSGPGSCVGGTAIPVIGGCEPAALQSSSSPSPSASTAAAASASATGAVAAASTTPFTGGPGHPFPVAATGIVLGGLALALGALFGPTLARRLRSVPVRDRRDD